MYCVKCGVELSDSEKKCPLCGTTVYHPEIQRNTEELYPKDKMPTRSAGRAFVSGAVLILFMIPIIVTFFADMYPDRVLDWFWYSFGGILLAYIIIALPMWFEKPNAVIFLPCDFVACGVYLFFINFLTKGNWFLTFALPVLAGVMLITCVLLVLLKYLKKGKLYVVGGSIIGIGGLFVLIENLMVLTFDIAFTGWSYYPLISLALIGGLLIYLAINSVARAKIERKIFF